MAAVVQDDFAVLQRWRDGERTAGSELLQRHFDSLYRFFRNKAGADCDDLIQRTFLACVESRDRFRGDSSFRSYLFTVARHELYRHYQKANRGQKMVVDMSTMSVIQLGSSPSSKAARREEEQILLEALAQIPVDLQITLELHYWEGMSTTEIAAVLEIPSGTVKSRLRRAREAVLVVMKNSRSPENAALAETIDRFEHWAVAVREIVDRDGSAGPE